MLQVSILVARVKSRVDVTHNGCHMSYSGCQPGLAVPGMRNGIEEMLSHWQFLQILQLPLL